MRRVPSVFCAVLVSLAAPAFAIDPGVSGLWYNPEQSGHRFETTVVAPSTAAVTWYTYNAIGRDSPSEAVSNSAAVSRAHPLQTRRASMTSASFVIPTCAPRECPAELLRLQRILLAMAESELGPRGSARPIKRPLFNADGPRLWYTPEPNAVRIELSRNAEEYWPTAIYEMAHEVVHLLDPVSGYTNCLEEGVAVEFALHAQIALASPRLLTPTDGAYREVLMMVRRLPWGALPTGRLMRDGSPLSAATVQSLRDTDPTIPTELAEALSEKCIPR